MFLSEESYFRVCFSIQSKSIPEKEAKECKKEREVFNVSLLLYSPLSDSQSSEQTKNENRCDSKVVHGHAFFY